MSCKAKGAVVKYIQGDVVGVYDSAGTKLVTFTYDAYGNCTIVSQQGIIGTNNPFRYRGYYWDSDLGLYYLQTRYYDPVTGRFINADENYTLYLGLAILGGLSRYSYCFNDPVNYLDDGGRWPFRIDEKNKINEHIHVKLGREKYAWYSGSKKTRDQKTNKGFNDLSKSQIKKLRAMGVPERFLGIVAHPNPLPNFLWTPFGQVESFVEQFPLPQIKYPNIYVTPIEEQKNGVIDDPVVDPGTSNVETFPIDDQEAEIILTCVVGGLFILLCCFCPVAAVFAFV